MRLGYYDIGDIVKLQGGFTSRPLTDSERDTWDTAGTLPAGTGVTPVDVVCTVQLPDGTTEAVSVEESPTGVFTAEFECTQAGPHWAAIDGTGAYQASGERKFRVREQQVSR